MIDRGLHGVLVVDDNAAARYVVSKDLRAAGFHVVEAAAGAEALELADFVSAVVLDVHLPDLLGFEVCRLLRRRPATASLPVVYLSGMFVSDEDQAQGLRNGGDAYLLAPASPEALVATLDRLIGQRRARRH